MKNTIAKKLLLYFALSLGIFSVVIGLLFAFLFSQYTQNHHKQDMKTRADTIARTLANYIEGEPYGGKGFQGGKGSGQSAGNTQGGGFGAYLRFIDEIALGDVWVVDSDGSFITRQNSTLSVQELPSDAETLIQEALEGRTVYSEEFSNFLEMKTLTIGTPIFGKSGDILGVVLVHSPISGMAEATLDGIVLLVLSVAIALAISVLVSWLLSRKFTQPLHRMNLAANRMKSGDYLARTDIVQQDEIGMLAGTLDELAQRLEDASHESEEFEQMRRDFISTISHELRTPVTVLRGSLEALRDGVIKDPVQVEEYYQQMLAESIQLQHLVNDLLELSRLQNTQFNIEKEPLDLNALLGDLYRSVQYLCEKKGVFVHLHLPKEPTIVLGDYTRLRQMLLAVADNAIKFTPSKKNISISLAQHSPFAYLDIQDEGGGIPPAELPYIFDKFHREKSSTNHSGTGLGLAIVKSIADRHNIKIEVQSNEGQGSLFRFIIHTIPSDQT